MFAYLISKLLCNIYRDVRAEKSASLERTKTSFGSVETLRETYLESVLKLLVGKIIFYVFIVISLHDWFTLGALAANKNCIHNTLLSRFSKSTERPTEKKISFKASES